MTGKKADPRQLFPTKEKAKIGKEHSWPIGAEALSAVLWEVPQNEFIELEFAEADRVSLRKSRIPLVFDVSYYYKDPTIFFPKGSPSRSPTWRLAVRAVPREWKHAVKTLLIEHGLPKIIKPWLVRNSGSLKRQGDASLRLWYNPTDNSLVHRTYGKIGPSLVKHG